MLIFFPLSNNHKYPKECNGIWEDGLILHIFNKTTNRIWKQTSFMNPHISVSPPSHLIWIRKCFWSLSQIWHKEIPRSILVKIPGVTYQFQQYWEKCRVVQANSWWDKWLLVFFLLIMKFRFSNIWFWKKIVWTYYICIMRSYILFWSALIPTERISYYTNYFYINRSNCFVLTNIQITHVS